MSLLFIDGFDHYATDDITKKWDASTGVWTIESTTPDTRSGGGQYIKGVTNASYVQKNLAAAETTLIVGAAFYIEGVTTRAYFIGFANTTAEQVTLVINADGSVTAKCGITTLGTSSSGLISVDTWYYIEFKVYIHASAGTVDVWLNGVSILSLSSQDTHYSGTAEFTNVKLYSTNNITYWDDLYFDDADNHGDCRVDTLLPDGAGNYSQFDPSAGSNYECVDDDADIDDDSTYVSTSTVDEIDSYDVDDLTTLTGSTIYGVAVTNCARKDDAGTRKFKALTRVNGSDYVGDEHTLTDSYKCYQYIWADNPDDAAAWEEADIDGGEFGLKLTT